MYRHIIQRYVAKLRGGNKAGAAARPRRIGLSVEALEDRLVPAVFNVNSLADILNPPSGAITLRSAIEAANAIPSDDTINLTVPGTYPIDLPGINEDQNATGDFDILAGGGNLTIVNSSGGKVIIDGGGQDRIFDINPTFAPQNPNATAPFKVTLQGLILQHGISQAGGGIRDTGNASLELDNCIVTNNAATASGGGIFGAPAPALLTLTLNNTVVSNNHAGNAGGGIDTFGSGTVSVSNSQFIDNTCGNFGAAIGLSGGVNNSAILNLTGTLVSGNEAFSGPGALGTDGNGTVTISGSTVSDNYSGSGGGGFGDDGLLAPVTITNSQFLNNVAVSDGGGVQAGGSGTTTVISNSVFAGNTSGGNGGGIFASGGTVTIANTRITANTGTNGGGIEDQAATLKLSFSELDNNVALSGTGSDNGGGGIDASTGLPSVTVANCLFLNNLAHSSGGAIIQFVGDLTVTNSQFTGNFGERSGGALLFDARELKVSGSTFNGNQTGDQGGLGGAVDITGGTGTTELDSIMTNDTFVGNSADVEGGAFYLANFGTVVLLNDTITGNTAPAGGGIAVGSSKTTFVLLNTIVALNTPPTASDIDDGFALVSDEGGNFIGSFSGVQGFGEGTLTGNPRIGPLQDNGGPSAGVPGLGQVVQTEALLPGSPAIGTGIKSSSPATDERAFPRPAGSVSIGAYEPQYATNATTNQVLVENFFEVLLGRLTDPGSAGFVNELNGGVSASTVALQIEGSGEYLGNQVQLLFQRYLHRQADAGSLQAFVNMLSHGSTFEQVAAIIVGSSEYFQLHGGNNVSFLNALFIDALGRTPDPFGQDSFSQALAAGASRTAVGLEVFTSPEYRSNLVGQSFAEFLGRQAFPEDLTNFTGAMQNGLTDQAFVAILVGSTEFLTERV